MAEPSAARGYNIETLCVDVTINPDVSKIILTTVGTKATVQKIEAQLARLIDVIKVENLTDVETVKRGAGADPDEPHGGQQAN